MTLTWNGCTISRRGGLPVLSWRRSRMQRGVARDDFLAAFASTDRAVSDFLMSEVLASLPPDLVDFLVETSVLDAFDAELCVAVTGVETSATLLDRLIASNLFVVELDDPPRWLRYHHLFGAFLRARLASLGASRLREANDRASRALELAGTSMRRFATRWRSGMWIA